MTIFLRDILTKMDDNRKKNSFLLPCMKKKGRVRNFRIWIYVGSMRKYFQGKTAQILGVEAALRCPVTTFSPEKIENSDKNDHVEIETNPAVDNFHLREED